MRHEMGARGFMVLMGVLALGYDAILGLLANMQRERPLPPEVADVYDSGRYRTYLGYVTELKRADLQFEVASVAVTACVVFLVPFEALARVVNHDPYLVVLVSSLVFWLARMGPRFWRRWHVTFGIEGRYGINRLTPARFLVGFFANSLLALGLNLVFLEVFAFLGEHLWAWTGGFAVDLGGAFLICVLLVLLVGGISTLSQLVNYRIIRQKYEFTPLPDGPLRQEILGLLADTHRRVRNIYVYDESTKSTKKNAFVLRILFTRDIGIADNFLTGSNSERELISVILHEIGHLKHRHGPRDFVGYALGALLVLMMALLVCDPSPVILVSEWCRTSFGLSAANYVLLAELFGVMLRPLGALFDIFNNWQAREEEYEADLEAVRHGYGEDLIHTFKQLSSDELVDVNPHPVVELLTYDHPGMYHRVRAIRRAEQELGEVRVGS